MKSLLGKSSTSPIGIDLGGRMIKAVQLARKGTKWRLHAAVILPQPVANHPVDEHTAEYVRDALYRHGFVGDDIVLGAPRGQLEVEMLELPPRSSGAPVEQIARIEMARSAKLENESFELECWDLPAAARGGSGTSVMAVAMRHQHAEALLAPFEAHGFNTIALDAQCCALARVCLKPADVQRDSITAVLDIGWNAALLVLIQNETVIYQRVLRESGLQIVHHAIEEDFHLEDDETDYVLSQVGAEDLAQGPRVRALVERHIDSMVGEIQAALQYALHRYAQSPVKSLSLVGGGAAIGGICQMLAARLEIERVDVLKAASIVECSNDLLKRAGDGVLTMAMGLAWHGRAAGGG